MQNLTKLLVIDDDRDICTLLSSFLTKNGYTVQTSYSGKTALALLQTYRPDLVLCDFRLDDMNGGELLEKIKAVYPETQVVIMTGYSDVRTAVQMMKSGASDYVTKPLLPEEILDTIAKSLMKKQTGATRISGEFTAEKVEHTDEEYFFGDSKAIKPVLDQIKLVSPTNFSVIIYGESGSGKESIAREIHKQSKRAGKPFIAIDCGSISKELAGSELFGHEKGAFTSAISQKTGSFELANEGTVFLDEIGNLSYEVQVTLLRVIQERKMRRVGGNKDIELDLRIIVASNERLTDLIKKGKFREDLYYRFNEFSIEVPALRSRQEDVMLYASYFLKLTNSELGKQVNGFDADVTAIFHRYPWPGNLRELKNVVKRCTLLCKEHTIDISTLPYEITHFDRLLMNGVTGTVEDENKLQSDTLLSPENHDIRQASIEAEYEVIKSALVKCNYNKSKAATLLKIDRKTLYNKMKQFKLLNHTEIDFSQKEV